MSDLLVAENLRVSVEDKRIISGLNLKIRSGEFHVVMGPNGSGKSTLALAIMGHPKYKVEGTLKFHGVDLKPLGADERARLGIMLAFQHPEEIDGVKIIDYLRLLMEKVKGVPHKESYDVVVKKAAEVNLDEVTLHRHINVGFSGGERKRLEILQALLLEPSLVILDEPDSGVDVDSLSMISKKLQEMNDRGEAILLITHYGRILEHVNPKELSVHLLKEGKIVMSGREELMKKIEEWGFAKVFEECGCNE